MTIEEAEPLARMPLRLSVLPDLYSICRLPAGSPWPPAAPEPGFFSVTRTADELSIVSRSDRTPAAAVREDGWRLLRIEGPLAFGLVGVIASLAASLAAAGVSIFVVSTYDTDYILVRAAELDRATAVLGAAGHSVSE